MTQLLGVGMPPDHGGWLLRGRRRDAAARLTSLERVSMQIPLALAAGLGVMATLADARSWNHWPTGASCSMKGA
jgi:hypothetical protein